MIQNILSGIENISLYGIISICIFFSFFTGVLIWAFALKKNYLGKMGSLPLDGGERPNHSTDKIQSEKL